MNIENLNTQELETLRTLLNKMAGLNKMVVEPKTVKINKTEAMIFNIIQEFDFLQVQTAMNVVDWKWMGEYVTIDMLQKESIRLLKDAAVLRLGSLKNEHWELGITCGTGGLQATACCDEDKTKITNLDLKFVLEEWDVDLEDVNNE
jgi:hypothetical protein